MRKESSDLVVYVLKRVIGFLSIIEWAVIATLIPLLAGSAKLVGEPQWWPANWRAFFPWLRENQWWLMVVVSLGAAVTKAMNALCSKIVRRRERGHELRLLLERLLARVQVAFVPVGLTNEPQVNHRLSLYRADAKQTRLRLLARSAEATSGSTTSWGIHADEQAHCEGVAGICWFLDCVIVVPGDGEPPLPNVGPDSRPTDEEIADYARRAFTTPERVRENRWRAQSYAGIPVRVDNRRWGVLVLDSISPEGARKKIIQREDFAAEMLGDIIKAWEG